MTRIFTLLFIFLSFYAFSQESESCTELMPICTDSGLSFSANSGVEEASFIDPGNYYGCLGTEPNPTWYYLQCATSGDILMELSAGSDIDYIIWGPFSSLSIAQAACGSYGVTFPVDPNNGSVIDCSYSIDAVEFPTITGANAGEVYVMLITNYADVVQDISLTQIGGTGTSDCDIIINPPCAISPFNPTISGCDFATNNYEINGSVDVSNPPSSGDLVVEDCDGNITVIASAPFNDVSYTFTLNNLPANGNPCTLQAYFTSESGCIQVFNYTAPLCVNDCPTYELQASSPTEACGNQMYWLEIENTGCDGYIEFDVVGNAGFWADEISWQVTDASGNIVASGPSGASVYAPDELINVSVGPLAASVGSVFTLTVFDSFGDGFDPGGFIEIQQPGLIFSGQITGDFGSEASNTVGLGLTVSSSTLVVETPSGNISSTTGNCQDHELGVMLNNTNFCTPISVDLPWTITCDNTGDLISSGTHTVIVYPQVPTSASDVVSITWNSANCEWDVSPNNDCSELDIGNLFAITPDAASLGSYCDNGTESFSVSYTGVSGAPNCCETAGPAEAISYDVVTTSADAVLADSPFGGTNNSALVLIPGHGDGGNATSVDINVDLTGVCVNTFTFSNWWVTIYLDGVIVVDETAPAGTSAYSVSLELPDPLNPDAPVYNENSIIEIYVYAGNLSLNWDQADPCPVDLGEWNYGTYDVTLSAVYEQTIATPISCEFPLDAAYTCCTLSPLSADAPAPVDVDCTSDIPAADINSVTNIVSDCPTVVAFVSDSSDGNTCSEIITRTYSVTDDCGNSTSVTQTITVNDITPPTASNPAGVTVECIGDVPASDISVVTDALDNCTAIPTVAFVSDSSDGNTCPEIITRTYSVTDACGNSTSVTQTITVNDITPPTATNPAGVTVECIGDVPASDISVVTDALDNCTAIPTVAFVSDSSDGNTCPEIITRTYSVTDDCGNSSSVTQTITVNDITPPTASNPAGVTVECIGDVPSADISVVTDASDNCTAIPTVAFVSDAYTAIDGYSVNDDLSWVSSTSNLFQSPDYDFCNGSVNYSISTQSSSSSIVPGTTMLRIPDNYNLDNSTQVDINIIFSQPVQNLRIYIKDLDQNVDPTNGNNLEESLSYLTANGQPCVPNVVPVTGLMQWDAVNQIVASVGNNAEGWLEIPGSVEIFAFSYNRLGPGYAIQIDTIQFDCIEENTVLPECSEVVTRIYSVTDDCGNSTNVTQTITVSDITPPTASNPPNIEIPLVPVPAPDITVITDAADNCTPSPIVAFVSDQSDGGDCPEVITRTYSVTDDCGNETLVTQLIIIGGGLVPSPTVTPNGPICEGEDAVFIIDGLVDAVVTYDVGAGPETLTLIGGTGDVTVPSVNSDVTITLSNIADGSCSSIIDLSATIVVTPISFPTFTSFGPYCQNETPDVLPVSSLEGYTGTWNPPNIDTSISGIETHTFTPDAGQCAAETTVEVLVTPLLLPAFLQIDPLCLNETAPGLPVLSQGGISGSWTPATINTSTVGISTYTFTPDLGQCADTVTMDIEIIALPIVNLSDQLINCITNTSGVQIGMAATVGNTYSWTPSVGLTNSSISDPIATPTITTMYTLTVTDALGCSGNGTINVTVDDALPLVEITNNSGTTTLTCEQLDISVTATGADTYSWNNGLGNIASPTIASPGIYTVTGTGSNGCQSTAQIDVIQDNLVDLLLALDESVICSGEAVEISINSTNATDFTWTVVQNGVTGASPGTVANTPSGASISQVLSLTGTSDGTVEYLIVPDLAGCFGNPQSISVTVQAPLSPQFNQIAPLCINDATETLPSNSLEGILGSWSPATVITNIAGTSSYTFTPNSGQCAANQTMNVVVNPLPIVSFSGNDLVGCAPHNVVLTSPNSMCTWYISDGSVLEGNPVTVLLTDPGCYDVTLEVEENGCTNNLTTPSYICVEEEPIADFTASPDVFTDADALVTFTNLSSGASSFIWDFGDDNTSNAINPTNLYENTEEGALITLTAVSDFGCTDQAQLIIEYDEQEVFYIPNTFTPDGDSYNQMFTPIFYSGFDPYNFEMLIFNRWGEIVFETQNAGIGWDGTYGAKGMKATEGTYSWKITYKNPSTDDRKVIVGHVTLLR